MNNKYQDYLNNKPSEFTYKSDYHSEQEKIDNYFKNQHHIWEELARKRYTEKPEEYTINYVPHFYEIK